WLGGESRHSRREQRKTCRYAFALASRALCLCVGFEVDAVRKKRARCFHLAHFCFDYLPLDAANASGQRVDDQLAGIGRHAAEGLAEQRTVVTGHVAAPARYDGNVLLAARAVGNHATVMAQTIAGGPELLAIVGGQRIEGAVSTGDEYQTALGGEQARER